jgi:hypothetical protein
MDSKQEYKDAIEVSIVFHEGNRMFAVPKQTAPVPLTDEQIEDLLGEANRGFCIEREDYFKAFRDAEAAHGITAAPEKGQP